MLLSSYSWWTWTSALNYFHNPQSRRKTFYWEALFLVPWNQCSNALKPFRSWCHYSLLFRQARLTTDILNILLYKFWWFSTIRDCWRKKKLIEGQHNKKINEDRFSLEVYLPEVSWDFYHVRISTHTLPRSSGIWKLFFDRNMALKDGPNKMNTRRNSFHSKP